MTEDLRGKRVEVHVERRSYGRTVDVLFSMESMTDYRRLVVPPLNVEWRDIGDDLAEPTLSLGADAAQRLMDELWRAGLRPSYKKADPNPQIEAMQAHLADMRELVFKHVVVAKPAAQVVPFGIKTD